MVNALRFAFNRTSINRGSPAFFDPTDLGVKDFYAYRPGEMVLSVTSGFNISGGTASTGIFWTNSYQVTDDVTLVRGRHQMGFGVNVALGNPPNPHARSGGSYVRGQTTAVADLLGASERGARAAESARRLSKSWPVAGCWRRGDQLSQLAFGEPFLGQQMLYGGATNFSHDEFLRHEKHGVSMRPGMTSRAACFPTAERLPQQVAECVARIRWRGRAGG
jgi:hypothetical protein